MSPEAVISTSAIERQDFMKGPGFVLYNDVTEQLIGRLSLLPLPSIFDYQQKWQAARNGVDDLLYESSVSLYEATDLFRQQVPRRENTESLERAGMFDISDSERAQASRYTHDLGLNDLDFTWHFSPAVASAVVHSFVESDAITEEAARALTLNDWSKILSSDWFSQINHDLARTGQGVYMGFGKSINDHISNALRNHLIRKNPKVRDRNLFSVTQNPAIKDIDGLSAELNPTYEVTLKELRKPRTHLTSEVDNSNSKGCPMARKSAMLTEDYAGTMPRASRLRAMGRLTISDKPNKDGLILARQEVSGIGRTLKFIGSQLELFATHYEDQLGPASKPL